MKLLKPNWVTHDGHPIFSLDIHPDCSRFATGGQGADTGRVVIWNMAPIINEQDENKDSVPKMLSQMDNHLACVNCVRWSSSGKFLASGGDDKVVMIWQIGRYGGSSMFGSGGAVVNIEQWRCINTLRGHSGDVLDLAWSPHDAWLASCSIDNTVIIWNALKFPEMITILRGHTGLVKGVTWDPVGKYLASQSDDKTLRVWRTSDWQHESTISQPFVECGGTTHVLRLSWSPDGQFLVSAHAMNNSGPTARIIEREGWKAEKDFVGHRKAVTCVRFNPSILSKQNENEKVHYFCCCAVGSRDRSLSIWLTSLKRPLVVIHDLFSNSVLDVSWDKNGQQLMACSWDGTIAFIQFDDNEIGSPLSAEEKNSFHHKMYGKSMAITNQSSSSSMVIESPAILKLKNSIKNDDEVDTNKTEIIEESPPVSNSSKPSTPVKGPNKQIETLTADGKRRITPCFIAPAPDVSNSGTPQPFSNPPTFSSSKESKSSILIEKIDETSKPMPTTPKKESNSNSMAESPKQIIVNGFSTKPQTLVNGALSPQEKGKAAAAEFDKPTTQETSDKITKTPSIPVSVIPVKRKAESTVQKVEKRKGRPPLSASIVTSSTPSQQTPKAAAEKSTVGASTAPPTAAATTTTSSSVLNLPVLKVDKTASLKLSSANIQLENNIPVACGVRVHRLQCTQQQQASSHKWQVLLSSKGAAIAGSKALCCAACDDSSMHVFCMQSGRRVQPAIMLPSPISRLTCRNHFVMAITSNGSLSVWNFLDNTCFIQNQSLVSLLQGGTSISSTGLTDLGIPTISISSGKTFMFHTDLSSWVMLSNSQDSLAVCSNHDKFSPDNMSVATQPLAVLQQKQSRCSRTASRVFASDPELQQNLTLSHLDVQLLAAKSLQSPKEYKFWLLTLVRFLTQECMESRLRIICDDLMGPVIVTSSSSWLSTILGLSKHDLLKEILLIISSNLKLQRLFTEYHDQLESFGTS